MSNPAGTSYDEVPYVSESFPETHPRRLQAVAWLFGMESPDIERCRVLELGCAGGGNLIPMAYSLPGSTFLGIDLSTRQIADAQQTTAALGLRNIEFRAESIGNLGPELGAFDYILCHGVFAWVPREVQDRILDLCRDCLSPTGVAYISYNTYPGWHLRSWTREVMAMHTERIDDPQKKVAATREFLQLLSKSPLTERHPIQSVLRNEAEHLKNKNDSYVLHEHLEEHNHPCYFREFMARASERQLQYLGDARTNGTVLEDSWPPARQMLQALGDDLLAVEQYVDFFRNQAFRRTLLCHASVSLQRAGAAERVERMQVASSLRPEKSGGSTPQQMRFNHPRGGYVLSGHATIRNALLILHGIFPRAMGFDALCRQAQQNLALGPEALSAQRRDLAIELLRYWMLNLVELHVQPATFADTPGEKPHVSDVVRLQARSGERATNLRHEMVKFDQGFRSAIQLMDGTRSLDELARTMIQASLFQGAAGMSEGARHQAAVNQISQALAQMAREALFVG